MHKDAVDQGDKVVLVDDLIATGGTAEGAVKLLKQQGADVLAACFIIDLPELGGADKIRKLGVPVRTLVAVRGALALKRRISAPAAARQAAAATPARGIPGTRAASSRKARSWCRTRSPRARRTRSSAARSRL